MAKKMGKRVRLTKRGYDELEWLAWKTGKPMSKIASEIIKNYSERVKIDGGILCGKEIESTLGPVRLPGPND